MSTMLIETETYRDRFCTWLQAVATGHAEGTARDPQARILETPTEGALGKALEGSGVLLPARMSRRILGALGKTNPLDSGGGQGRGEQYLVPTDYWPQVSLNPADPHTLLSAVTVVPTESGTIDVPRGVQTDAAPLSGIAVSWGSEGGTKPETQPAFEQERIVAHPIHAHTQVTNRLLARSTPDLEALLERLFARALRLAVANAIINGTGTGQPVGIVNQSGVRTVPRAAPGSVAWSDIVDVKHALAVPHLAAGARYVITDAVEEFFERGVGADGEPAFLGVRRLGNGRLNGLPYHVASQGPALGATGDVICGYWPEYWLCVEPQLAVRVARSEHVEFVKNVTVLAVFAGVGGRAVDTRAFCILSQPTS